MRWLDNRRIAVKVILLPLVPLLCLIALTIFGDDGLQRQDRALTEIARNTFPKAQAAAGLRTEMTQAQADLYRLMTWSAAGVNDEKLAQVRAQFEQTLAQARRIRESYKTFDSVSEAEAALIAAFDKQVADYESYVREVFNMLAIDFTGAVSFLWSAQDAYTEIDKSLVALSELERRLVDRRHAEAEATIGQVRTLGVVLAVAALLLSTLFAILVGRRIARPVARMTAAMQRIAAGELDIAIPAQGRRDEVGRMADLVELFRQNAVQVREAEARKDAQRERDEADRHRRMTVQLADEIESRVRGSAETVNAVVRGIQDQTRQLRDSAHAANDQSAAVASVSQDASNSVDSAATAAERLVAAIRHIQAEVGESKAITRQAVDHAGRTDAIVGQLDQASRKIGDVIDLIDDIAAQTNLLALNATIEAARAGEAGKGFAVVANEVKQLASQTSTATSEITSEITAIKQQARDAVAAIGTIAGIIGQVDEALGKIATAVDEQGTATQEISRNVAQAASGAQTVSSDIHTVQQIAEATGSSANTVGQATQSLSREMDGLLENVDGLVAQLRSA